MKKLIALIVLTTGSGIASANGFQPWENRTVANTDPTVAPTEVTFNGFAPWRDRAIQAEQTHDNAEFAATDPIGFRPWS